MNIHFYICPVSAQEAKTNPQNAKAKVYIYCYWGSNKLQKFVHINVHTENFLPPKQQSFERYLLSKEDNAKGKNLYLQRIKDAITEVYQQKRAELKELTREDIANIIRAAKTPIAPHQQAATMAEVFADWQEHNRSKKSASYLRTFKQYLTILEQFLPGISVDQITGDFVEEYTGYLLDEVESIQSNNTIRKHVKFLCMMLRHAKRPSEWLKDTWYTNPDRPALTWEELGQLVNTPMSADYLEQVRDCTAFIAITGLRYSDALKLRPLDLEMHNRALFIKGVTQRTRKLIDVPACDLATRIIEQYLNNGWSLLSFYSNQKVNEYLKEVAAHAGLTRQIKQVWYRGSERIETLAPLHQVISCHIMRHTFVIISLQKGMSVEELAELMGVSRRIVMIYAKVL